MIGTTDPQGAKPGWYRLPAGGVGYWDGWRWTGERGDRAPRTPWTTWLAWLLLAWAAIVPTVLVSGEGLVPTGTAVAVGVVPAVAAVALAVRDAVRGRGGRFPTSAARALLTMLVTCAGFLVLSLIAWMWAATQGG